MRHGSVRRGALLSAGSVMILVVVAIGGCATKPALEKTGEFIDDSAITTKVKSSFLADPMVRAFAISVATSNGVVRLKGFVDSERQRQRAIQLAQTIPGVKEVDDRNLYVERY